jgi:opacity protein-like surface antigen
VIRGAGARATLFELHPSIGLSEHYSDNFNRSSINNQENFRTTVSPRLTLLINGAFTTGTVRYHPSLNHDTTSEDWTPFQNFLGRVIWQATPRLTLTASDVLVQNDQPEQADQLSLRLARREFTRNTFSLKSDYLVANVATTEYYRLSAFLDDDGRETISHTIGAGASTTLYSTNTVSLGYEYLQSESTRGGGVSGSEVSGHELTASAARQMTSFLSGGLASTFALRDVTSRGPGDDNAFSRWGVTLFSSYAVPNRLSMTSSVGFARSSRDRGGDTSSVTTASTLTYHFARATVSLGVDQGFSETFTQGENFGLVKTRGVRASFTYGFTPFVTGRADAHYRENEPVGDTGAPASRARNAFGGTAALSVELLRWLDLDLEYRHSESTTGTRGEIIENRATVSLDASF